MELPDTDTHEWWTVEYRRLDGTIIWSYDFVPAMHTAVPEPPPCDLILPPYEVVMHRIGP